jgi:hypothetical protein
MNTPVRIRTTISITPEAHAVFKRMAEAANMSTSKAMGEWLADTSDAAEMIVLKMEEAKKAPLKVMREMQSMLAGLSDTVNDANVQIREIRKGRRSIALATASGPSASKAPSSNTGLKSPPHAKKRG